MDFIGLKKEIQGELYTDEVIKRIYSTDASAYREVPLAVAIPKSVHDLSLLVRFARTYDTSLIPRAAGTSLAGQVVGEGIVVDVSKYFNNILEINLEERYVWVQPGVVRDELNIELTKHGYFFAPETSTANRAMIGGMIGNNSCGANSIVYGSVREHLLEVKAMLSDGSEVHFKEEKIPEWGTDHLKQHLYQNITEILMDQDNIKRIKKEFPKPSIPRRNTGYALDVLARMSPFNPQGKPFNFCSILAGSEGTLAFITAAKLKLTKLPSKHARLVCIHCESIDVALKTNLIALQYNPHACELIDHYILEATKRNTEQRQNRFFVEGDPKAILIVELIRDTIHEVDQTVSHLIADLITNKMGYAFPVLKGSDITKVWMLRKAGLGLLSNVPGDAKPVPVIEDTAVDVKELPAYIRAFNELLGKYGLCSVHYAHAGSGELHLRPIINLKTKKGRELFRVVAEEITGLVKKYGGSLSGEHGDGRLRGEFIPKMIGEANYQLLRRIKNTWDPHHIFNPGKIIDAAPMDTSLRYEADQMTPDIETIFDFSEEQGIVRATERCNGSGDCRKSALTGGTMCPSYMATRDEKDTTRARANILREFFTSHNMIHLLEHRDIKEVMSLCLSCKGCKRECPSNVDMAKLKAEWQYQSYQSQGIPWRVKMVAHYPKSMQYMARVPWLYNMARNMTKPLLGFSRARSIPKMVARSLRFWYRKKFRPLLRVPKKHVYFFFDEFTNYLDVEIGKKAIMLLDRLGYKVQEVPHQASGRTYLSKGLLEEARQLAEENVAIFSPLLSDHVCLIGIEPSAILTFRDEYPDLLRGETRARAIKMSHHVHTIDEFLAGELDAGNISSADFSATRKKILVHGHCHQKAIASMTPTKKILSASENHEVQMIPSGCCGMAGSFGYEKECFDISMNIGELILFPKIREAEEDTLIVASGTSCRHQILDGTGKRAYHLVEIL